MWTRQHRKKLHSMELREKYDVLIIGGGPAGLTLALQITQTRPFNTCAGKAKGIMPRQLHIR
jgi:cation diffusion facilitator CzcD-associated flavoprotein CzcO